METEVNDNPGEHRFEIRVDGELAGFAVYEERPGARSFTHTEIDDSHEGQGLGGRLVAEALDATRAQGLDVLPFCPFVKHFISENPEYLDLVPADQRGRFGIG